MSPSCLRLVLLTCLVCASPGFSQETAPSKDSPVPDTSPTKLQALESKDERLAGFRVPAGFRLEVVADSPTLAHPVALTFADDGSLHVLQSAPDAAGREEARKVQYKDGSSRSISVFRGKSKDVVKILSASKPGAGFDQARSVLEDDGILAILHHDGQLYVAAQGSVRRHKAKEDGSFDSGQIVAQGFDGFRRRQGAALTIGPDGWLYIGCGAGDNVIEGSDGSRASVLRSGAIFRCRPDGGKLHVFVQGLGNTVGNIAFDPYGHAFVSDGGFDPKVFNGARLLHAPEGGDFGWRLLPGEQTKADPVRVPIRGQKPGALPPLRVLKASIPGGLVSYNDTRLPEEYRGLLFLADAGNRTVRAYKVEVEGASFDVAETFEIIQVPKEAGFRPRQLGVGPDGGMYLVDGRRLYRVSWAGTKEKPGLALREMDAWAKLGKAKDDELIKLLGSEDASERERVARELVRRGEKNRSTLLDVLQKRNVSLEAKINALGVLQAIFNEEVQAAFVDVLANGEGELQRLAAEALGRLAPTGDRVVQNGLLKALAIEDRAVRRTVAVAMGRLRGPGAGDNLAAALSFDRGRDMFLQDGLIRGLEMLGKPGMDALLALAASGAQKETDRVVEVFRELRTKSAFESLVPLLKNPHVSPAQQVELIRSCRNYQLEPAVSLDPIVTFVISQTRENPDGKKALLQVLATPGTTRGEVADAFALAQLKADGEEVRQLAVRVLGTTAEGATRVGKLFRGGELPASLLPEVKAALARHASKDATAAKLLEEINK